jgi:hypothetical protein
MEPRIGEKTGKLGKENGQVSWVLPTAWIERKQGFECKFEGTNQL